MKTQTMQNMLWMAILVIALFRAHIADADTFDHNHKKFDNILQQFVEDGRVDYSGLLKNRGELDVYLKSVAVVPLNQFQSWTRNQQLAFLINLYNAQTLKLILDHYPVESIKDIGSLLTKPWDLKVVDLFGKSVSLNTVEHEMIRKNYNESRIHFAVVCAAIGCPKLRSEAYRADRLNDQLNQQAQIFLDDREINRVNLDNATLHLSPIFKWYKEDFEQGSHSVASYISRYFGAEVASSLRTKKFKIRYTEYDWSLNKQ